MLKAQNSTGWIVCFQRVDDDNSDEVEHYVQATRVILGAGSLGSTKILLRSKERGLPVSDELGKRFSTNGDVLATSFNGDHFANTVGVETKDLPHTKHPPGPTITVVADFRKVVKGSFENHFVLEDFNPPSMFAGPYSFALPFAADLIGIKKYPSNEMFERLFQVTLVVITLLRDKWPSSPLFSGVVCAIQIFVLKNIMLQGLFAVFTLQDEQIVL